MERFVYYKLKIISVLSIIIFGSGSSILFGLISSKSSYSPVFNTLLMFIGETICIVFYFRERPTQRTVQTLDIQSAFTENRLVSIYEKIGNYGYCIISLCEFLNSVIIQISSIYISNVYVLVSLGLLSTIFVFLYRVFYGKRKLFKHEKLGILLYLLGILMIIVYTVTYRNSYDNQIESIVAIGLIILAQFFDSIVLILSQNLLEKIETGPALANFVKGITGLVLTGVLYYPISLFMNSLIENPEKLDDSKYFPLICVCLILDLFIYNYTLLLSIKSFEALTICFINSGRVVIVFIISTINDPQVDYLLVVGGFFIVLGSLVFNEIICIRCWGFEKDAKKAIKQSKINIEEMRKKNTDNFTLFKSISNH